MSFILIKDGISSDLKARARAASNKRPLLLAMGQSIKALGVQAFTDSSKRPQYWAPRKDDYPHPLLQGHHEKGGKTAPPMLRKSIRGDVVQGDTVFISSDRPYAATHQLGRDHIPARPFLPFYKSGQMTSLGRQAAARALLAALRVRGL